MPRILHRSLDQRNWYMRAVHIAIYLSILILRPEHIKKKKLFLIVLTFFYVPSNVKFELSTY